MNKGCGQTRVEACAVVSGLIALGLMMVLSASAIDGSARAVGRGIFEPGARIKVESRSGLAGDAPTWAPELGLLATGRPGHINVFDAQGRHRVYREGKGIAGMVFDRQGRLIVCESGERRISTMDPGGNPVVLTDRYDGKRYNSPNDIALDGRGRIYFSDPRYGSRQGMEMLDEQGQVIEGVYRIDPDGRVVRIIAHELERPNGLVVTADDRYLVAVESKNVPGGSRRIWRFPLREDGTVDLRGRKILFDWGEMGGPDGMKQDQQGRLYVAGSCSSSQPMAGSARCKGGLLVIGIEGDVLDYLPAPDEILTNCGFGGSDLKTLYMTTAKGTLLSIRTTTPGRVVWPTVKAVE
jgi:gluconolactonase